MDSKARLSLPSLFQFALSGLVLLVTIPAAFLLGGLGLVDQFSGASAVGQPIGLLSLAWVALLVSILILPSAVLALLHLMNRQPLALNIQQPQRLVTWLLLLWPLVLLMGALAARTPALAWLFLPPLKILAIGIPIWFVFETGRRGLSAGSTQRAWGILGFGLIINPLLAMVLETLLIIFVVFVAALVVSSQPDLARQAAQLYQRLRGLESDPQTILQQLQPLLQSPAVILTGVSLVTVLMPMIEELVKPAALWFLAPGGRFTPAQGFVCGLISGGAFGLMESLTLTSNVNDIAWTSVIISRLGTGLLHTVTTGLMGWALASAFTERRYLRLGLTYILAVGLHGLWNLFGLFLGVSDLLPAIGQINMINRLSLIAPIALIVLALVLLAILVRTNERLRASSSAAEPVQNFENMT